MLQAKFNKTIVASLSQFEEQAESWNSLWADSSAYEAISRAEGIAVWMRHFEASKADQFRAILVHHCEKLVGGFAFYLDTEKGFSVARLPVNDWVNCGELFVDSSFDEGEIIECIVESLLQSGISLLVLQQINLNESRWQRLVEELERQGRATHIGRQQQVGVVDIQSNWENYFASLSGNHRSAVRRSEKKIRKAGQIELLRIENPTDEALQKWMRKAMEIENRSWKLRAGTSILASQGMEDYFLEEARIANAAQSLELWFLCLNDTPIAFEYCHNVKGVCISYKIGYDESYKAFGPGRLLRKLQLESLNSNPTESTRLLDTKGILCDAKAKWTTRTYPTATVLASVGGVLSNLYVRGYSTAKDFKHRLQSRGKH